MSGDISERSHGKFLWTIAGDILGWKSEIMLKKDKYQAKISGGDSKGFLKRIIFE